MSKISPPSKKLFSAVKRLSCLNQERNMHRSSIVYKWKLSKTILNKYVGGFWCGKATDFITGGRIIIDYGLVFWPEAMVWNGAMMDLFLTNMQLLFHKMLIDGLEWCGLVVDYCDYQLFGLSFWRHPFTAQDPLMSKWCDTKCLQICSDEAPNSSTSWMAWG